MKEMSEKPANRCPPWVRDELAAANGEPAFTSTIKPTALERTPMNPASRILPRTLPLPHTFSFNPLPTTIPLPTDGPAMGHGTAFGWPS